MLQRHRAVRPRSGGSLWPTAAICLAMCGLAKIALAAEPDRMATLIRQAGNCEDDARRVELLKSLQNTPQLDAELAAELRRLVDVADRWANSPNLTWFGKDVRRKLDYDMKIPPESPLYPLACFYRGRMLCQFTLECGGFLNDRDRRRDLLDPAVACFRVAKKAFPENRIARMYLGEPLAAEKSYAPVAAAPDWAVCQRESLERLGDIVHWWIDHRMQPDGSYGGGWGDDCEMWRWWVPVLIAFDDPAITAAQARFSQAIMSQPHMAGGYMSKITDVEHSAEDSADAITPMMHLDPDNPAWRHKAMRLAELMETLWTGRNERGFLQFKSTFFAVDRVDPDPQKACDTVYHPRTVQPALLLWQRTGDPRLGALFTAWMDTWVDATARDERGKPAGIIPSAIHWPDGRVGGLGRDWWHPENRAQAKLYRWPSAMSMMTDTLLLTYHMTDDPKYLAPLRSMAAIRLDYLKHRPHDEPPPGSKAWCAAQMSFLGGTLAKYRQLTGSHEFDALLSRTSQAYPLSPSDHDRTALTAALKSCAEALRINFPGYTSEVRYTDRVLRFPRLFEQGMMFPEAVAAIRQPNPGLLYSTTTGDPGDCGYFPLATVRWLTPPRQIAALVTESAADRFTAGLFHFGPQPRKMSAELYLLAPGRYTWQLTAAAPLASPTTFTVSGPRTQVTFELPSQRLCTLRIVQAR